MACPRVYNIPCEGRASIVSSCYDRDPDLYCQSLHESLTTNCESTCSKSNEVKFPISEACSTETPDAQIKPGVKSIELMELSVALLFNNTNGVRSDSHSPAIPGTGKESSVVDEKSMIKESCKHTKASRGNQTDLPASYSNLATTELQAIKASDLDYLKELGAGTYGTIYHGKWKGSDVAIKKLRPSCFTGSSTDKDRLVADFWKEAHILGQLHHPNIVAFYGVVTDGPVTNLATVTEYMVNKSRKQVLTRKDSYISLAFSMSHCCSEYEGSSAASVQDFTSFNVYCLVLEQLLDLFVVQLIGQGLRSPPVHIMLSDMSPWDRRKFTISTLPSFTAAWRAVFPLMLGNVTSPPH